MPPTFWIDFHHSDLGRLSKNKGGGEKKKSEAATGERVWGGKATVDGEGALRSDGDMFGYDSFR